jgi:polysaccharide export outer membrane protein
MRTIIGRRTIGTIPHVFLLGFTLSCIVTAAGQNIPTLTVRSQMRPSAETILPSGTLGPDDMLEITVSDCPELTRTFRVSADDTLILPLLTKPIPVAGSNPSQLTEKIKQALIHEQILTDPIVNVSVLEYRSRPVSLVGAVNHPLTFQVTGQMTLLDAIAMAGGLSPTSGGEILVTGAHDAQPGTVKVISAHELLKGASPALNLKLYGGEDIRVPEGEKVFVAGNVIHPGMYAVQSDAEMTVIKAISLSSGLAPFSAHTAYIYRRQPTGTERDEVKIELSKIISHKSPDIALRADDILYVPTSTGKKMATNLLMEMTGVGQAAAGFALVQ